VIRLLLLLALALNIAHAADGAPDAVTPDGARYYGSLRNGKFDGHGKLEWDNGTVYEGGFRDGVFSGRGKLRASDGRSYSGEFARGQFDGRGRFEAPSGEIYEGDFVAGEFTGRGTYSRPDGARYRGEFVKWRLQGQGRFIDPAGNIYEGQFKDGAFEGQGTLTYAKARPDGRAEVKGLWHEWRLVDDAEGEAAPVDAFAETALFNQRRLLDEALGAIEPGRPGVIDMYVLAIGGDGAMEVFRREAEYVRGEFDQRYGTKGRSIALVNSRRTAASAPMATLLSIGEALKTISARMNRDEDILFLFLTSHGSRNHELALQQSSMKLRNLPARELGHMLKESGIRWKVVVVSACYSGGFIDPLRDDSTLIITAARYDRSSFGCADENDFTYFGRAFFKEALPASRSFQDAFSKADALVAEWERKDQPGQDRSLPQIYSTPTINAQLARWWASQIQK
jgi:hypothetical protein